MVWFGEMQKMAGLPQCAFGSLTISVRPYRFFILAVISLRASAASMA